MSFLKATDLNRIRDRALEEDGQKSPEEIDIEDGEKVIQHSAYSFIKDLPPSYFRERMLQILDANKSLRKLVMLSNS